MSTLVALVVVASLVAAGQKPQVVKLVPEHLDVEVDPAKAVELRIEFDRPMSKGGYSLCGGGPSFPKVVGSPQWEGDRTLVAKLALEPDHDYSIGLNCPASQNLRSKEGEPLEPRPWTFSTLPEQLPPAAVQQKRNEKATAELARVLAEKYSYYDLRVKDWKALFAAAKPKLLAARTDKGWAVLAARTLEPAGDLHLVVKFGESVFSTGSRAVDTLYRRPLVEKRVEVESIGDFALSGRTEDGIGYVMIGAWTAQVDLDGVERALGALRDCKAMVVDVRPNSGGDELLARRIAAWFVEGTKTYAKNRFRVKAGKDGFGPVLERQVEGNSDAAKRFRGPIAVLVSPCVMSSNESFVAMLEQAADCTLVGQPTYGSSGNPRPVELGNGAVLVAPTWQDLRLDGECREGKGIEPDVLVPVDAKDLESRDPILEKALELLRAKLADR